MSVSEKWNVGVQGYMSSPIIVKDYAYVHLRNQRFACFDLKAGTEKWRSKTFGKYSSMIASDDKILALDQRGDLLLFKASPDAFELLDRRKVGDDSWAHLAISGKDIVVRDLKELSLFKWGE
jgi:outer membrane protein assembly factor BamB